MTKKNDKSVINNDVFKKHIIIHRAFVGKKLTPEEFAEFAAIVNQRRPYCSADFEKHHFFENIATTPAEAAFWHAHGEFCIKAYGD